MKPKFSRLFYLVNFSWNQTIKIKIITYKYLSFSHLKLPVSLLTIKIKMQSTITGTKKSTKAISSFKSPQEKSKILRPNLSIGNIAIILDGIHAGKRGVILSIRRDNSVLLQNKFNDLPLVFIEKSKLICTSTRINIENSFDINSINRDEINVSRNEKSKLWKDKGRDFK